MASEFTLTALLDYADSEGTDFSLGLIEFVKSITTKKYVRGKVSVATSEQAIDLGVLTAPLGWALFINLDATNYVEIRSATGAANDILKVPAASAILIHFGSDVSAPYIIANTAACQVEYVICAP